MSRQSEIDKMDKVLEKHIIVGKISDRITMDVSVRTAIAEDLVDKGFGTKDRFEIKDIAIIGGSPLTVSPIDYKE